jgi:hypothetical protein
MNEEQMVKKGTDRENRNPTTLPLCPPQIPDLAPNPGRRDGKSATNHLS